nr:MAG TPA: hypothetical protein [Caudoviricetes sp.]
MLPKFINQPLHFGGAFFIAVKTDIFAFVYYNGKKNFSDVH